MWGHYTNSYKGFCIKFKNLRSLLFNEISVRSQVTYLKNYSPTNESFDNTIRDIEKFTEIDDELRNIILHGMMAVENYTWKHIDWSYEREFRAISYSTHKFNRKLKFDLSLVDELYLGHKMKTLNKKNYAKLLEIIKSKYPHIKLFEVNPNPIIVKLDFNEKSFK